MSTVLSRSSELLNNPKFSDIKFSIQDGKSSIPVIFYGHKTFLAMASPVFATIFYSDSHNDLSQSPRLITMTNTSAHVFFLMLKYIYTDIITIEELEDAYELLELSSKYKIEELENESKKFISENELSIETFFEEYENALSKNDYYLHRHCTNFLLKNSTEILKSEFFHNASENVVEEIIKQDELNVESELEVIRAVINWGVQVCKSKKLPAETAFLRNIIDPFIKHFKFLTLSDTEFCDFVENYDILTSSESTKITMKILSPNCDIKLPKTISICKKPRRFKNDDVNSHFMTVTDKLSSEQNNLTLLTNSKIPEIETLSNFSSGLKYRHSGENNLTSPAIPPKKSEDKFSDSKEAHYKLVTSMKMFSYNNNLNDSVEVNTICDQQEVSSKSDLLFNYPSLKVDKTSNLDSTKIVGSGFNVSPLTFSKPSFTEQSFEFPLREMPQSGADLNLSIKDDIRSIINIAAGERQINIKELKLRIKDAKALSSENFTCIVAYWINSRENEEEYTCPLSNGTLSIMLKNPLTIPACGKVKITVTIENVLLQRCYYCIQKEFTRHHGKTATLLFSVESNKKISQGMLFLISSIVYSL